MIFFFAFKLSETGLLCAVVSISSAKFVAD